MCDWWLIVLYVVAGVCLGGGLVTLVFVKMFLAPLVKERDDA